MSDADRECAHDHSRDTCRFGARDGCCVSCLRRENAALTERLRVAKEHATAIEDRILALKAFVVHENGAHKVLLHNFDVMVAFFGDKDQPHRWDDLTAVLVAKAQPEEAR